MFNFDHYNFRVYFITFDKLNIMHMNRNMSALFRTFDLRVKRLLALIYNSFTSFVGTFITYYR